jgi:MFS family permease
LKDKRFSQVCTTLLLSGSVVFFFAPTISSLVVGQILSGLGSTVSVYVRSLITSLVSKEHYGVLFAGISTMVYGGVIIGGPLLAEMFSLGMKLGEFWMGLPFLVAGGFFAMALISISAVKLTRVEDEDEDF